MTPDQIEGYAIGYYYGRGIGSDEPGREEIENRFSTHSKYEDFKAGFKDGYERGVTDYVDYDEDALHDCSDADRPCDNCLTRNLPDYMDEP